MEIKFWAKTWQNQQDGCAPSEDSDQPGHPPSLIRVFAVRMKKAWDLSYPLSAQRMPRLTWVFAGRTAILLVLSCRGSESLLSARRKLGSLSFHWQHSEDWSEWEDAQADLSLRWAHIHFVGFVILWLQSPLDVMELHLSHRFHLIQFMRLWHFSSSVNSFC